MSNLKPLILWVHGPSPNPVKVAICLEELGLPYEAKTIADVKAKPFTDLNPNGRAPALQDPNTGVVLWEVSPFN
jgi:glutathione S-transferase